MGLSDTINRAALMTKLKRNAVRRGEAMAELELARAELRALLREGRDRQPPASMTKMCEAAGINRERAYDLLRRAELPSPAVAYTQELGGTE